MKAARGNYSRIIKKYRALGKGDVRLTEGTLTLIQPISASKTQYSFPVLENESQTGVPPLSEEIRLNINDEFIVGSVAVMLYGSIGLEGNVQAKQPYTYAPSELNATFNNVADFYAGFFSAAINKINYVDKWDLRKHENTPRTQFANLTPSSPATKPNVKFEDDGVYLAAPNFTLSGAKKNELTITLPNAITASQGFWIDNNNEPQTVNVDKIIVICRGLLAQNAARFQ